METLKLLYTYHVVPGFVALAFTVVARAYLYVFFKAKHLSLFRFKKLADMYGRESDSEDSQEEGGEGLDNPAFYPSKGAGGPPGSESWC